MAYKARLKKNGVKVLSAHENISDDASGVLMEAVLAGMAEYFSYGDLEVIGGIPRIIDDVTFEQTQILMEKNKKAPARAKSMED